MKTLNLTQGTPEWLAVRAKHFTASEAPAMLGLSKYQTRSELLRQKKTGLTPEVDTGTQRLFERGHAAEAAARPIAEALIEDELFPATGMAEIDGLPLLASFDGITMDELTIFEHKLWNQGLADFIQTDDLPDTHWPQVEHQLLVSGAERCLFVVSDGTEANHARTWYVSSPERRQQILGGWKQFAADLADYQPEEIKPEPVKAAVESLPAVFVQVQGSLVCQDNIQLFADALQDFIGRVPAKPQTDEDFAACEAAVKTLDKAETALKAAKESSLGYVQSLADLHRLIDNQAEIARSNRLRLEKLVKAEKENRKTAIVGSAANRLNEFVASLRYGKHLKVWPDFVGAIKGLKTMASIQNAVDTALAEAKLELTRHHERIASNADHIQSQQAYGFLFRDFDDLIHKEADFVALTVQTRIADHQAAEAKRLEAERGRIRQEEAAKLQRETDRLRAEEQANAEREAARKAEQERIEAERMARQEVAPVVTTPAPVVTTPAPVVTTPAPVVTTPPVPQPASSGATMTLGKLNSLLAPVQITADGLRLLGFEPVGRDRAAVLYDASAFTRICTAIVAHLTQAAASI